MLEESYDAYIKYLTNILKEKKRAAGGLGFGSKSMLRSKICDRVTGGAFANENEREKKKGESRIRRIA